MNESRSMAEAITSSSSKTTTLVLKSVRGGRIDYNLSNYCATCGYKLTKELLRCPDCKQKVRT